MGNYSCRGSRFRSEYTGYHVENNLSEEKGSFTVELFSFLYLSKSFRYLQGIIVVLFELLNFPHPLCEM